MIVGAVFLIAARHNEARHGWLDATTSQGGQFQAEMNGNEPLRLSVDVRMRCPAGTWQITWVPSGELSVRDGRLHVTETSTHHYRFHNQTGRRTLVLDAHVGDRSVEGTVTSTEHFVQPGYGPYTCASGPIRFAAAAD